MLNGHCCSLILNTATSDAPVPRRAWHDLTCRFDPTPTPDISDSTLELLMHNAEASAAMSAASGIITALDAVGRVAPHTTGLSYKDTIEQALALIGATRDNAAHATVLSTPAFYKAAHREGLVKGKGVVFVIVSDIPGAGTPAEKCFMYRKDAVGWSYEVDYRSFGYDHDKGYWYLHTSATLGTGVLDDSGVMAVQVVPTSS